MAQQTTTALASPNFGDDNDDLQSSTTNHSNVSSHPLSFSSTEQDVFHSSYETLPSVRPGETGTKSISNGDSGAFDRGDSITASSRAGLSDSTAASVNSKLTAIRLDDGDEDEDTGIFGPPRISSAAVATNGQESVANRPSRTQQIFLPQKPKLARSISDEQAAGDDENANNSALEHRAQASPPATGKDRTMLFDAENQQSDVTAGHQLPNSRPVSEQAAQTDRLQSLSSLANDPYMQQQLNSTDNGDYLRITISEPSKVGEGMQAYIVYKLTSETNMPLFPVKLFSVVRRFSDFLGLYEKLLEKYAPGGRIVPPAPDKSVFGITKLKVGSTSGSNGAGPTSPVSGNDTISSYSSAAGGSKAESALNDDDSSQSEFVIQRRSALERFMNRLAQHSVFRIDPDFREFITLNEALPRATNTSAFSVASSWRLLSKVGENLTKISSTVAGGGVTAGAGRLMDEKDPWFEERALEVERMEQSLKRLYSCVEALAQHRRDVAMSISALAGTIALLANSEEHTSLSRALSQLAESQEDVEMLVQRQSRNDHLLFGELLHDYIGMFSAVQNVFNERCKAFGRWQHAQLQSSKRREQKTRAEWSGKQDKAAQLDEELAEWNAKVEKGEKDFENISNMIKREFAVFNKQRLVEMRQMLTKYVKEMIHNEKQLIKVWEMFGPETKSITTS